MAEQLGEAVLELRTDSAAYDQGLAKAKADAQALDSKLKQTGENLTRAGKKMTMAVTLPIVGVGVASMKTAGDFDQAMSRIVGLVGVPKEQVEAWREDLLELSKELGRSPTELADALYYITSAGQKGDTAMETLTASAKAAIAGLGDIKTVADAATSAMNAYGEENLSAEKATDILVATVREGKAEASEIADSIGRVIPLASQMGVRFDEVGGVLSSLTRIGFSADEAATSLTATLSAILSPSEGAEDALNSVGLSAEELRRQIREQGLLSALQSIDGAFKGNTAAMADAFPNVRALRGALGLLGENADETAGIMDRMQNTTGDTDRAFQAATGTIKEQLAVSLNQFTTALTKLGEILAPKILPMIEKLAGFISNLADWFEGLNPRWQEFLLIAAGASAALGPGLAVAGQVASGVSGIMGMINIVGPAIMALFTGPAAPFVLAGAAAIALAVLIATHWDEIKEFTINLVNTLVSWFTSLKDKILKLVSGLVEGVKEWLVGKFQAVADLVKGITEGITGAFNWLKEKVVGKSIIPDMVDEILVEMKRLKIEMDRTSREAAAQVAYNLSRAQKVIDFRVLEAQGGEGGADVAAGVGAAAAAAEPPPLLAFLADAANAFWNLIQSTEGFQQLMQLVNDAVSKLMESFVRPFLDAIAPTLQTVLMVIGDILQQTAPFWQAVAQAIGMLAPVLAQAIVPLFYALVPILNAMVPIVTLVAELMLVLIQPLQGLFKAIGLVAAVFGWLMQKITAMGLTLFYIVTFQWGKLGSVDWGGSLSQAIASVLNPPAITTSAPPLAVPAAGAAAGTAGAVGAGATYEQPRPINITFTFTDTHLYGMGSRELAMIIRRELESLDVLGL
jgi:TP901 family phage tail tape measure protein